MTDKKYKHGRHTTEGKMERDPNYRHYSWLSKKKAPTAKGPVKRKVPKGRAGSTISAVRHAAANPKPKKRGKPTKATGDYTHARSTAKPAKAKKKPGPIKRLVKFARGDYNK